MNDQLREYFVNIFEDLLCAYRKHYSCQCVLVKMVDDWKVLLDKNHIIGAIFMDLSNSTAYPMDLLPQSFELTV